VARTLGVGGDTIGTSSTRGSIGSPGRRRTGQHGRGLTHAAPRRRHTRRLLVRDDRPRARPARAACAHRVAVTSLLCPGRAIHGAAHRHRGRHRHARSRPSRPRRSRWSATVTMSSTCRDRTGNASRPFGMDVGRLAAPSPKAASDLVGWARFELATSASRTNQPPHHQATCDPTGPRGARRHRYDGLHVGKSDERATRPRSTRALEKPTPPLLCGPRGRRGHCR